MEHKIIAVANQKGGVEKNDHLRESRYRSGTTGAQSAACRF